jgi:hypothetical protein
VTDSQGERGPWTAAEQPGNCHMCGCRWEQGALIRHDPNAGGLVCVACGQDESVPGILDQLNGRLHSSLWTRPVVLPCACNPARLPVAGGTLSNRGVTNQHQPVTRG